jgi:hypothetical protein
MTRDESTVETHHEEEWLPSCYDCDREAPRRYLQQTEIMDTSGPGIGYEYITVPLCSHCRQQRYGYDCPHCGLTHDTEEDAVFCCRRRPGEAPDCPNCNRRMKRTAWGYTVDGKPTCEFAVCEGCGVEWGKYTGWHKPEDIA